MTTEAWMTTTTFEPPANRFEDRSDSKLIVFVGPDPLQTERVAEMAGHTLTLRPILPFTTGERENRVSPHRFLQMLQDRQFIGIYDRQGELYGIRVNDVERTCESDSGHFVVATAEIADKLKAMYGDRVFRIFVGPAGSAVPCELSLSPQDDEAYMMFALAQALEPLLDRGLVERD